MGHFTAVLLSLMTYLWKASGDIEKQQRTAWRRVANRGLLFNVRHSPCHSPHHSLRYSPHRFLLISLFKLRYSMFAAPLAIRRAIRCRFSMSPDAFYGKRQGTLKNNSERLGESRFAIQCSPRRSLFAAPFPIYFVKCSLFKVRYSMFAAPFASLFAAPFAIRRVICRAVSYSFSLFKLRYSMFAAPLAIHSSPFVNR